MEITARLLENVEETKERYDHRKLSRTTTGNLENLETDTLKLINPREIANIINYKGISESNFLADSLTQERILNDNDLLPVSYLFKGIKSAKAVARITLISQAGREMGFGTGFLVGKNLLITNNHVFQSDSDTRNSLIEFGYEADENGSPKMPIAFRLDPDKLFITSKALDFTLVYVQPQSIDGKTPLSDFGSIELIGQPGKSATGKFVSIIQHPSGNRKSIALRNNKVIDIFDDFVHYETDTEPGSSGSPAFNDDWELIALHHSGVPKKNQAGNILNKSGNVWVESEGEETIDWIANEGIRVSIIVRYLQNNAKPEEKPFLQDILKEELTPVRLPAEDTRVVRETYYDKTNDDLFLDLYYQQIDSNDTQLFGKLSELLQQTHKRKLDYRPSKYVYPDVDIHEDGLIESIYSGKKFDRNELIRLDEQIDLERKNKFNELSRKDGLITIESYYNELDLLEASLPYNCEHVVPQSWFQKKNPMKGDIHHLFACESNCNSFRSNIPYFDFVDYDPQPLPDTDEALRQLCGKRENEKFEPENN
ncbi:MAG: trypsin-like peptidase domain-containing protein, partial [Verrucomicrobia bacterium]|nr:trypsin-like peptidase domain-containing protein [Cytophagales bacterium]